LIVNLVGDYSIFNVWCAENNRFLRREDVNKFLAGEGYVDLDIRQSGNICCLKLKGPLKYGEGVKQLDQAVEGALNSGHIQLLLDLSAMPYIDSSGIGAIVDALRQAKKLGGDAKLVSPSPFAAKTFKMVGILTLFKVYDSEAAAMEACPA
jgi:anti-sigma B factor antagonist